MRERISKSLYKPSHNLITRLMQVSHNLNRRAEILKILMQFKKDLSHSVHCLQAHNDEEPFEQLYADLDYLIENEREKLLQETESPKG